MKRSWCLTKPICLALAGSYAGEVPRLRLAERTCRRTLSRGTNTPKNAWVQRATALHLPLRVVVARTRREAHRIHPEEEKEAVSFRPPLDDGDRPAPWRSLFFVRLRAARNATSPKQSATRGVKHFWAPPPACAWPFHGARPRQEANGTPFSSPLTSCRPKFEQGPKRNTGGEGVRQSQVPKLGAPGGSWVTPWRDHVPNTATPPQPRL